ncbi:MAG TPA: cytochrome c oxidase subunit 3 [Pyrinomonadaceae bacterium]|nr:cytochrome c oxidase subunit 3 [Pyrinomonadaceae bacterium]
MSTRTVIDISELPKHQFDTHDPVWWGNAVLLAIETTMFGILIATYFYLRQNFTLWPPPIAQLTDTLRPLPEVAFGTANTILLVASCAPMIVTDLSARRNQITLSRIGLIACILFGVAALVLRAFEFPAFYFRWDSNAYGSAVWFILGMHTLHLIVMTVEAIVLTIWIFKYQYDIKHRVDIVTLGVYWYWVVGVWLFLYAIIYFTPRMA